MPSNLGRPPLRLRAAGPARHSSVPADRGRGGRDGRCWHPYLVDGAVFRRRRQHGQEGHRVVPRAGSGVLSSCSVPGPSFAEPRSAVARAVRRVSLQVLGTLTSAGHGGWRYSRESAGEPLHPRSWAVWGSSAGTRCWTVGLAHDTGLWAAGPWPTPFTGAAVLRIRRLLDSAMRSSSLLHRRACGGAGDPWCRHKALPNPSGVDDPAAPVWGSYEGFSILYGVFFSRSTPLSSHCLLSGSSTGRSGGFVVLRLGAFPVPVRARLLVRRACRSRTSPSPMR